MAKPGNVYYETFVQLAKYSYDAATYLQESLERFQPETLKDCMAALHEIEHAADETKHEMTGRLAKEFVTPIEREDINLLANEMDEVTDKVEDVLIRLYMYNVREIRIEALAMANVIQRSCGRLVDAMREFPNFHKSTVLHEAIVEVNNMEEEGDALYVEAMRRLFTDGLDAVTVLAWSEVFDRLEDCCDSCEHVANVLESVVMKNS